MGIQFRIAMLLAALPLLGACASEQVIDLKGDGSGTAIIRFEVQQLFVDYFTEEGGTAVFDAARVKQGLEKRPGFRVTRIATPNPRVLEMELAFDDIRSLVTSGSPPGNDGIISVTSENGKTTVALHLDRRGAKKMGGLLSDVSNPAFKEMSPREQRTRTEQEYLEAIEFAVGKEGPPLVKASYLKLTVKVDGQIASQAGGSVAGGAAVFKVPLLRMLMLETPLDYSVTFTPSPKGPPAKAKKPR